MALVVLLLVLPPFAAASVVLQQPEWDWEPSPAHISEHCLAVPSVPGEYYNSTVTWRNNSRLLYLAVPEGKPPPGGWPVLVDLLTVDYPAGLYSGASSDCGLQGKPSESMDDAPPPQFCLDSMRTACAESIAAGYLLCARCANIHARNMSKAFHLHNETGIDCSTSQRQTISAVCPKPPPIDTACSELLNASCPTADYPTTRTCAECVSANVTHSHNKSYPEHNPMPCARNMTSIILTDYCKENGPEPHDNDLPGNVRSFRCEKRPFWSQSNTKIDHFAKTGSGQTGKVKRKGVFAQAVRFAAFAWDAVLLHQRQHLQLRSAV
jgi:hypothetical protein